MIDVRILWPIWLLMGALVFVAWLATRARLHHLSQQPGPSLDDAAVRQIVEEGRLTTDEEDPLDIDEVRREEQTFWDEERWDESEEY